MNMLRIGLLAIAACFCRMRGRWKLDQCAAGQQQPCFTQCGTQGSQVCINGTFSTCTPPVEQCNGKDDNCNGQTDAARMRPVHSGNHAGMPNDMWVDG